MINLLERQRKRIVFLYGIDRYAENISVKNVSFYEVLMF